MKLIASIIGLCIVTLTGSAPSVASDCAAVRRVVVNRHRAAVVVDTVLIADHGHYGYAYGGYSVGYAPDNSELLGKVFEAYKAKSEEHAALLKSLLSSGGDPLKLKAALAPMHPGLAVLNAKCAACHTVETKAKGGNFAFLNGGSFVDQGENIDKVLEQLDYEHGGTMPKGGAKLTDSEILAVERFGRTLPPQDAAPKAAKVGMPPAK